MGRDEAGEGPEKNREACVLREHRLLAAKDG